MEAAVVACEKAGVAGSRGETGGIRGTVTQWGGLYGHTAQCENRNTHAHHCEARRAGSSVSTDRFRAYRTCDVSKLHHHRTDHLCLFAKQENYINGIE